ncbi:hypothetical protein V5E97_33990 [Singulisphaera sp. Ch08]|uniref:DUF4398 domain-containing protein n=1 Tax=Singulisphaera sp. Ch08 TaxID=3120278 RepID=A0AAU7CE09_9BACT
MIKILTMGASSLIGIALVAAQPPPDEERGGPPPPPPPRKKADEPPGGALRRAYELLRRLRADGRSSGRPEERLKDWTERASTLYRDAVKAHKEGDERRAHEYGIAAHDLARAVEHSKNASVYEERDSDLPPPPEGGRGGDHNPVRGDLWHAHDRVRGGLDAPKDEADKFYIDAARDLYNAARRDAEAGRLDRAGELAKAAIAITHVSEHLAHALHDGPPPPHDGDRPEAKGEYGEPRRQPHDGERPKAKRKEFEPKRKGIAAKRKEFAPKEPPREGDRPRDDRREGLPPPL